MKIDIKQLKFIDPLLASISVETEAELQVEFTITSLYRIGDTGVHGTLPVRGMDWSCHDLALGTLVQDHINSRWQYDYTRPKKQCCLFHAVGGGTFHLHLQVCENTVAR